jgi:D-glycerate 3-kinase
MRFERAARLEHWDWVDIDCGSGTCLHRHELSHGMHDPSSTLSTAYAPVIAHIAARGRAHDRPLLVGLCGPQGSGKSTLSSAWHRALTQRDIATAVLSLDDVYLTREEREALSRRVHSLFLTRGVPGTHDVPLALRTIDALAGEGKVLLPSFDKALDDRKPLNEWPRASAPVQVILFEGWCVGAIPQPEEALAEPINELERNEDAGGTWRRAVNRALASEYRALFGKLDLLVLLQAPSFDVVYGWRRQQEQALRNERGNAARVMSDAELARFIQHYERLTRHILDEMPTRADIVVALDALRNVLQVSIR